MKRVRDIMTSDVVFLTPDDNVYEAALLMKDKDIGVIPVCESDRLLGIVTDRDLVVRGLAEKRPGSNSVMNVLTKDVTTVSAETDVTEAVELMSNNQIRRLPVCENDRLIGMLSLGDLAIDTDSDKAAEVALSEISEPPHLHH
ncbi:CBS domain-containing protein [Bacillus solimangrovi]|uniref:CBS domain-containing protein n=1 Tax=Bacillus solimangrovi TaxID=1305675 RepID=A0A1E5LIL2_9BACI|nr:CBS domain-containing protein [Bacillus solimangrovi]OEH93922.1 CBS domain-containing protein [Bacillus solimangrovi]